MRYQLRKRLWGRLSAMGLAELTNGRIKINIICKDSSSDRSINEELFKRILHLVNRYYVLDDLMKTGTSKGMGKGGRKKSLKHEMGCLEFGKH